MKLDLNYARDFPRISTVDMHTGGEPLRIIRSGIPVIPGKTINEKILFFKAHYDHLRTRLMWEPRGHADMYGAVLTEPVSEDSDHGVLFLHNEGYSSMCGHAIIALTTLLARSMDPLERVSRRFRLDVPSGVVTAYADFDRGKLINVAFDNVPSFVVLQNQRLFLESMGDIVFDLAFGGAYYVYLDARQVNLKLNTVNAADIIAKGKQIKKACEETITIEHPTDKALSFLYGVIFYEPSDSPGIESKNACVFADGELDRSATGTGVSGKAAILHAKGKLKPGETIWIESIIGSKMSVTVRESCSFGPYDAIIPRVSGSAFITGTHEFIFDENDPFVDGFFIR